MWAGNTWKHHCSSLLGKQTEHTFGSRITLLVRNVSFRLEVFLSSLFLRWTIPSLQGSRFNRRLKRCRQSSLLSITTKNGLGRSWFIVRCGASDGSPTFRSWHELFGYRVQREQFRAVKCSQQRRVPGRWARRQGRWGRGARPDKVQVGHLARECQSLFRSGSNLPCKNKFIVWTLLRSKKS